MVIKRKSRNIAVNKAKTQANTYLSMPQRALGYGEYIFPNIDDVPADQYYSVISHIENAHTRAGEQAIAVYYDIAKFSDVYRKINKLSKKNEQIKILKIKQLYPLESDPYMRFLEAMYEALNIAFDETINFEDCIGLREAIKIGYTSRSGIGGILQRCPFDEQGFIDMYEDEQEKYSSAIPVEDEYVECDEWGNWI